MIVLSIKHLLTSTPNFTSESLENKRGRWGGKAELRKLVLVVHTVLVIPAPGRQRKAASYSGIPV